MKYAKRTYVKPQVKSEIIKRNFLQSTDRMLDSVDDLFFKGEVLLAQSGCGSTCGSGPKEPL